ncbi:MAG: ASPIC/UnbV domain-containing protein [Planctomycetota bacterium]
MLTTDSKNTFSHLQNNWGNAAQIAGSTRGLLAADLNQDGKVDVVALNARGPASLLKNESESTNYLHVCLIGTGSNRNALGAKIQISQGDYQQIEQIRSGHSYQSDLVGPIHFGLPSDSTVKMTVVWPDGQKKEIVTNPGSMLVLIEE